MGVLMWEKPEKIMSIEDWKAISADSAPPGVYVPNMSERDRQRWKATLKGTKLGRPWIEIRKSTREWGTQMLIIVSPGGGFGPERDGYRRGYFERTKKVNVQISQNGPADFTFKGFEELQAAVTEARQVLEAYLKKHTMGEFTRRVLKDGLPKGLR